MRRRRRERQPVGRVGTTSSTSQGRSGALASRTSASMTGVQRTAPTRPRRRAPARSTITVLVEDGKDLFGAHGGRAAAEALLPLAQDLVPGAAVSHSDDVLPHVG